MHLVLFLAIAVDCKVLGQVCYCFAEIPAKLLLATLCTLRPILQKPLAVAFAQLRPFVGSLQRLGG